MGGAESDVGLFSSMMHVQMLHEKVYSEVLERLEKAYRQVKIGDPLEGQCY